MVDVWGKHLIVQWQQHKHRAWYYTQPLLYVLILAVFMGMASLYGGTPAVSSAFMVPLYALVALISYQRHSEVLFFDDFEDGSLKQYVIHKQLMPYSVAHTLVWWGLTTLPLFLVLSLASCVMSLGISQCAVLFATVMLASISTAWICAFANAVSLSHQRPDFLRALITLPLLVTIYVLAMGVGSAPAVFWLLLSLTVFLTTLMPFAVCWALKVNVSQ